MFFNNLVIKTATFALALTGFHVQADDLMPVTILEPTQSLATYGTYSKKDTKACSLRVQGFERDTQLGYQRLRFDLIINNGSSSRYTLDFYMRGDVKNLDLSRSALNLNPTIEGTVSYTGGMLVADSTSKTANSYAVKTWKIEASPDLQNIRRIELIGADADFSCEF